MALPFMAGSAGMKFLRMLYKGKAKLGTGTKMAADVAGKKGFTKTSQFISGTGKKSQKGYIATKKLVKKYPKSAAAVSGAVAFDIFDDD